MVRGRHDKEVGSRPRSVEGVAEEVMRGDRTVRMKAAVVSEYSGTGRHRTGDLAEEEHEDDGHQEGSEQACSEHMEVSQRATAANRIRGVDNENKAAEKREDGEGRSDTAVALVFE